MCVCPVRRLVPGGGRGEGVFSDHLGDAPVGPDWDLVLEAEWKAGASDPYRHLARLWRLVARRTSA
ncbi:hypothetical protein [Embleya scabrispora]|uniref:hypothetical protein n=1 Tax=Embleya scabrispora TaxID=159449 RepID=UPI0004769E08|nr:hypothetical protein [Embleya scabrispora]MYS80168.1 hypothetical protein [Streptomyces sp. SID5474]